MKRILIIGGGYAGLTAASRLARRARGRATVELIDQRGEHQALPVLPDIVGRGFQPAAMRHPLAKAADRFGFSFRQETVTRLAPETCSVETQGGTHEADALVIATGTKTTFHGLSFAENQGMPLDTTEDGERIRDVLAQNKTRTVVVCGGGYTGVELATAVRRRDRRENLDRPVVLVDLGNALCAGVPERFQRYVHRHVLGMGIDVRTGTSVQNATAEEIVLSDGETLPNALLLWTAGVGAPDCARSLPAEKTKQGRLYVEPTLQLAERCFAAGDAAAFRHGDGILRMSVQFAISQGQCAADNALRALEGRAPRPFNPFDPGYLIPMANNRACGLVLGCPVYGRLAIFLHYTMCSLRSVGFANRRRVAANALRSLAARA